MRATLFLLAAALMGGCSVGSSGGSGDDAGASGIALTVDRAVYRPGDAILLTLSNRTSDQIGYNLCNTVLDRLVGDSWDEARQRLTEACTMELRTMVPGESTPYRHQLPNGLSAGVYRMRTRVEAPLGRNYMTITSTPFDVQ